VQFSEDDGFGQGIAPVPSLPNTRRGYRKDTSSRLRLGFAGGARDEITLRHACPAETSPKRFATPNQRRRTNESNDPAVAGHFDYFLRCRNFAQNARAVGFESTDPHLNLRHCEIVETAN
jgi:hypothetical protein